MRFINLTTKISHAICELLNEILSTLRWPAQRNQQILFPSSARITLSVAGPDNIGVQHEDTARGIDFPSDPLVLG
jgi:hypothetical protein